MWPWGCWKGLLYWGFWVGTPPSLNWIHNLLIVILSWKCFKTFSVRTQWILLEIIFHCIHVFISFVRRKKKLLLIPQSSYVMCTFCCFFFFCLLLTSVSPSVHGKVTIKFVSVYKCKNELMLQLVFLSAMLCCYANFSGIFLVVIRKSMSYTWVVRTANWLPREMLQK